MSSTNDKAAYAKYVTVNSYSAVTDGVLTVATVDARRTARADGLSEYVAHVRARHAAIAKLAAIAGLRYEMPAATYVKVERRASDARDLRDTVRSFVLDREDAVLHRGQYKTRIVKKARKGTPKVIGGPRETVKVRAFGSALVPTPSEHMVCSVCGVRYNVKHRLGAHCNVPGCTGVLRHEWTTPPTAERFAMAQSRSDGAALAEHGGSAVEYVRNYDAQGVWLGTYAKAGVGVAGQLEVAESCCASNPPRVDEQAAHHEERRQAIAQRVEDQLDAVRHANRRAEILANEERRERRALGRHSARGKRGGRR